MVCENTLRIKNLPKDLSNTEKEDLLRHFGAQKVKVITSGNKQKSVVFAQFESKEVAKTVLLRLHQIKILNARLCVEFAEHGIVQDRQKISNLENIDRNDKKYFQTFLNKLNAFNNSVAFNQPPPSHLRYMYPKPNRATINNIAHALASIPKFYTQVLHLMNKMNLPPPFSDVPDPPIRRQIAKPQTPPPPPPIENSSESELESDPESATRKNEIIPVKRSKTQKKIVKRPKFIKPTLTPATTNVKSVEQTDEVFEKVEIQQNRKIELKVSSDSLDHRVKTENHEPEEVGSFGILLPPSKPEEMDIENTEQTLENNIIDEEELNTNRIPLKDLSVLPVFKDYHPGAPTCRLYIKNIAKTVEPKDLEYIFRRYKVESDSIESVSQFDIRLMQEGRMKGQAFITLDSVELAQKALKETNGFILKDKPLVVVFARSAVPKK